MPFFKPCSTRGCPEDAIEGGAHCAEHTRFRRTTAKNPHGSLYGTARWTRTRKKVLARDDYTCVLCGEDEVSLGGQHKLFADHFIDHDPATFYDLDKLRTLCCYCSGREDGRRRTSHVGG